MPEMRLRPRMLAVVFLAAVASARGDSDAEALARFKSEYPAASKRLEDPFHQVKGSCLLSIVPPGESRPTRSDEATFALDHGHEMVAIKRKQAQDVGELLYCIGPDTTFYLTRLPGAKSFVANGVGSTSLDRSAYVTLFGRFVKAHFACFGQPLTRLMARPEFRVVGAQYVNTTGQPSNAGAHSLVKVDFESETQASRSNMSVVFDPDAQWIIRSSEYRVEGPSRMRITTDVEYGPARDGVYLPRRVTCRDGGGESSICEFRDWSFEPTPEEEFKPTHYGLPNLVDQAGATRSLLPYWLGGLGAATFMAAVLLRRYVSRARSSLA